MIMTNYIKRIGLFILSIFFLFIVSSCNEDVNKTTDDSIEETPTVEVKPEYSESYSSGSTYSSGVQPAKYLFISSRLKVKTEPTEQKNIELKFSPYFKSFDVDDPALEGLSTKEILELYSDFDQRINYSITRYIYSGTRVFYLGNNYYYEKERAGENVLSKDVVYSKEDTLGYFVKSFDDDFISQFTFTYDELSVFNVKNACIVYVLTIVPVDGDEIRLLRPASNKDVNLYSTKYTAETQGINVGDSISYVHFRKDLEKEFTEYNYVNLHIEDGKISPLPYEKKDDLYQL